jgi:hypothetical protein
VTVPADLGLALPTEPTVLHNGATLQLPPMAGAVLLPAGISR